jgi:glucokinase
MHTETIGRGETTMILAGDIGGTSARLAFYEVQGSRWIARAEKTYPSRQYGGLEDIAREFAAATGLQAQRACFGIAGPVRNGRVVTSNLAWTVDAAVVARELRIPTVTLINDLEANAYGVACLKAGEWVELNPGAPGACGNLAVVSAGTGLGEAGVFWDGKEHHPFACEGGHSGFAPRTELEIELLRYLRGEFGAHVSIERVLSGPGLVNIYRFLRDCDKVPGAVALDVETSGKDLSASISTAALAGTNALCVKALEMFVGIYGAEAGNFALKIFSMGGMYIGGGIAPKILEKMKNRLFMEAFLDKGRMRSVLEAMPVRVIINPNTALLGAARCAALILPQAIREEGTR